MRFRWLPLVAAGVLVAGIAWATKSNKRMNDEERGEQLYDRHCVACHGAKGAGDGKAAAWLMAGVPDLRGRMSDADTEKYTMTVLDGRGLMPGFEMSFDRYDARRVVRYMATIAVDADHPAPTAPKKGGKDTGTPAPGED